MTDQQAKMLAHEANLLKQAAAQQRDYVFGWETQTACDPLPLPLPTLEEFAITAEGNLSAMGHTLVRLHSSLVGPCVNNVRIENPCADKPTLEQHLRSLSARTFDLMNDLESLLSRVTK